MPNPNHNVIGKVYFPNTGQVVVGASVTVTDTTLNESLPVVTNSSGEYLVNLANLDSVWTAGNGLSVIATYGNRSKTETGVISSAGSTVINLTLDITEYYDFSKDTRQAIIYNATDIMDVDKTFTRNSAGRVTKEVHNYGKFTLTKYFKYENNRIVNENWVIT